MSGKRDSPSRSTRTLRAQNEELRARLAEAEEALVRSRDELESRVHERTTELAQINAALTNQTRQLRALTSELTLAEQRERHRLAQVLHDHLQQLLVAANLHTAPLQRFNDDTVRETASQISDLIRDAIAASRSLTAELSPPVLHDCGLIAALRWLARWMHEKHQLDVEMTLDEQAAPKEEDVRVLLFQAVRELLFNVAKHADVKTARVEVGLAGGRIRVNVADDGEGFDPSQIRTEGGLTGGFGLFSIRERLGYLGGRMDIDSAPGAGSRFTLLVPMGGTAAAPPASAGTAPAPRRRSQRGAASPSKARHTGRIRVLLADDHTVTRQGLARLLKEEPDIEVVAEAADGCAAIELTRQLLPHIVIMDVSMPVMPGIDATRVIHSELPEVKIIGLSMFEELDQGARMREAGAIGYLTKSGPPEAVIAAIRAHGGQPA